MVDLRHDHILPMDGGQICDSPLHGDHLRAEGVEDTTPALLDALLVLDNQFGPTTVVLPCLVPFEAQQCPCERRLCIQASRLIKNTITLRAQSATRPLGLVLQAACDLHHLLLSMTLIQD